MTVSLCQTGRLPHLGLQNDEESDEGSESGSDDEEEAFARETESRGADSEGDEENIFSQETNGDEAKTDTSSCGNVQTKQIEQEPTSMVSNALHQSKTDLHKECRAEGGMDTAVLDSISAETGPCADVGAEIVDTWSCEHCSYGNHSDDKQCGLCHKKRPKIRRT